jgi:arsenate reductase-like glutaredoxin family protein
MTRREEKIKKRRAKRKKHVFFLFTIFVVISGIIIIPLITREINKAANIEDKEPPKIEGAKDQTVFIGEKVSYKSGVTVIDNIDESVELIVDSSSVNLKEPGSYSVIYKAIDSEGNTSTETKTIIVKEKVEENIEDVPEVDPDREELDELASEVLDSIINEGMSEKEKAKAIYNWARYNIAYVNTSDKSDVIKAAIQGIKKKSGDCYVYFATAQELLNRANIQNQDIVKTGGGHYWSMINLGEGWYHFDATPRVGDDDYFFMLTDSQLEKYSKKHKNSHVWDKDKYPATPK